MRQALIVLGAAVLVAGCDGPQGRPEGPELRDEGVGAAPVRGCVDFDLDFDGAVGFGDYTIMAANFGQTVDGVLFDFAFFTGLSSWYGQDCPAPHPTVSGGCYARGDLDGDGALTQHDLGILQAVADRDSPRAEVLAVADFNGTNVVGDGDADAMAQALARGGAPLQCVAKGTDEEIASGLVHIDWERILDANYDDRAVRGWLKAGGKRVNFMGAQSLQTQCRQPDAGTALTFTAPASMASNEEATIEIVVDDGLTIAGVSECPGQSEVADGGKRARCTASLCELLSSAPRFEVLSTMWNYREGLYGWYLPQGYVQPSCVDGGVASPEICCIGLWDDLGDSVQCSQLGAVDCTKESSCYWDAFGGCYNLTEEAIAELLPSDCDATHITQFDAGGCSTYPSWIESCDDLRVHYFGHGMGSAALTNMAYNVCEAADSCSTAHVKDWGCETFWDVGMAQRRAQDLAQRLEDAGRGDVSIRVVGNQRVSYGARECLNITEGLLRMTQSPITFWVHDGECQTCNPYDDEWMGVPF